MNLSRREMLLASLGLLAGCAQRTSDSLVGRPQTAWPQAAAHPSPVRPAYPIAPRIAPAAPPAPAPAPVRGLALMPRSAWTSAAGPVSRDIHALSGARRITVHHEGWTPFHAADARVTAQRIEQIRSAHTRDRRWADIGYHFIIDPAGRVWEGRNLRYQGAHVAENNEHNVGVMLLGNFDKQWPSDRQLGALRMTLRSLMQAHRVPVSRVYTHQELKPTACPGRRLQPRVASLRSNGYLA